MAVFSSRKLGSQNDLVSQFASRLQKRPFVLFGLPFIGVMVLASFGLESLTRTRYDYHESKVQSISKEDELHMAKDRKKVDIREEYYRLQNIPSAATAEWENVRVPRPAGIPEWGAAAGPDISADAPVKGQRADDRLV